MGWNEFIAQILIELGGFTAIVISLLKFFGNKFIEGLSIKYQAILTKELEEYKSNLELRNQQYKVQFDATFEAFSQIQLSVMNCFKEVETITPSDEGMFHTNIKNISEIEDIVDNYKLCLNENILLIPKDVYTELKKVLTIFNNQIEAFKKLGSYKENDDVKFWRKCELTDIEEETTDLLRDTLSSFEFNNVN